MRETSKECDDAEKGRSNGGRVKLRGIHVVRGLRAEGESSELSWRKSYNIADGMSGVGSKVQEGQRVKKRFGGERSDDHQRRSETKWM